MNMHFTRNSARYSLTALFCTSLLLNGCVDISNPNTSASSVSPAVTTISTVASETLPAETTTETTDDTKVKLPYLSVSDVPFITQNGLLPTGCELVSALMLLKYHGVDVTIDDVIANTDMYSPKNINGRYCAPKPTETFIGTPYDEHSFGCYAPVIYKMLQKLLPENLSVMDTTGTDLPTLAQYYIAEKKMPMLVWATIDMKETYEKIGWYLLNEKRQPTNEYYFWKACEHCLVLVGYDDNYYYFNDPLKDDSPTAYEKSLVEDRYNAMGKMSLVVLPT